MDSPIIRPGQGTRGDMATCSTITTSLLCAMDKLAHGITFCTPNKKITYTNKVKMFVDDATKYVNDFIPWLTNKPFKQSIANILKHNVQIWERCLWTSGGLLKLLKCLYYIMY